MEESNIEKKINAVSDKIVREFKPDKIMLFGSYAWGKPGSDSDVDLLVIKESNKTRLERQKELRSILSDQYLPIDVLVYTSAELEEQVNKKHNLFLEDVVRNGVVLYSKKESREINITDLRPLTVISGL